MKEAIIGGLCAIIGAVLGAIITANFSTNSFVFNINGEEVKVTQEGYSELKAENEQLRLKNQALLIELQEINKTPNNYEQATDNSAPSQINENSKYYIIDRSFFNSSDATTKFNVKDYVSNTGDTYYNSFTLESSLTYKPWLEYIINNEYNRLTGTYFLIDEYKSYNDNTQKLKIYGDDKLLYATEMKAGIVPIDFDIDVSDINILKIEHETDCTSMSFPLELAALSDVQLHK